MNIPVELALYRFRQVGIRATLLFWRNRIHSRASNHRGNLYSEQV